MRHLTLTVICFFCIFYAVTGVDEEKQEKIEKDEVAAGKNHKGSDKYYHSYDQSNEYNYGGYNAYGYGHNSGGYAPAQNNYGHSGYNQGPSYNSYGSYQQPAYEPPLQDVSYCSVHASYPLAHRTKYVHPYPSYGYNSYGGSGHYRVKRMTGYNHEYSGRPSYAAQPQYNNQAYATYLRRFDRIGCRNTAITSQEDCQNCCQTASRINGDTTAVTGAIFFFDERHYDYKHHGHKHHDKKHDRDHKSDKSSEKDHHEKERSRQCVCCAPKRI
ncbi:hypothetical protein WR25_14058 isoform A [Diploscapter pachys]|uniref:Uncharacterized protein n=1 Tax=Diploscapter pachys TaxID=2018661 RepID=A0A2A2JFZ8_9BILA|nr:hypothetical protein WR25_14058 isoform A [Diploscapter pachys]